MKRRRRGLFLISHMLDTPQRHLRHILQTNRLFAEPRASDCARVPHRQSAILMNRSANYEEFIHERMNE